jgi:glucose dehydrogenase
MRSRSIVWLLLGAAIAAGPNARQAQSQSTNSAPSEATYSELAQIDSGNAGDLQLAFKFRTDSRGAEAGAPPVVDGTLYLLTPFPHTLLSLEFSNAAARLNWKFTPSANAAAAGLACCGRIDHGPIVDGGRVYFTTLDGHVISVDAASGKPVWDQTVANPADGETLTGAPALAGTRVLVGNSGDDFGVRGWIAALDAATGRILWCRYSTGPDADVGIGGEFAPPHRDDRGTDLGVATWPPSGWQHGGGSVSGPIRYDPELGLVFHGTGHPAPWNAEQRPGHNKWTSGLFARDPDTARRAGSSD